VEEARNLTLRRPSAALAKAAIPLAAAVLVAIAPARSEAASELRCKGKEATITENVGGRPISGKRDRISGTNRADVIVSLAGKDKVFAGGGNDLICTGPGNDYVYADRGKDRVYGQGGKDYLLGAEGNDRIYGGPGDDWSPGVQNKRPGRNGRLVGSTGNDLIKGGGGRDLLRGNEGDDDMYGQKGDDDLDGGDDRDFCSGGSGFDRGSECERRSGIDDPSWMPVGRIAPLALL
jgi:hypothetical protein